MKRGVWVALAFSLGLGLLVLAHVCHGADIVLTTPAGTLETCSAGCAAVTNSRNFVDCSGANGIVFQYVGTGTIDVKMQNSSDNGTTITDVTGASCTTCSSPQKWAVTSPNGEYRVNIGTCTGCTYTVKYKCANFR